MATVLDYRAGMKRVTILVVEDNPITRRSLREALSSAGYLVDEETTGRGALERVAESVPDLVIQSVYLPDMDGVELAQRMRTLPRASRLPIIGVAGFLPKSVGARVLGVHFDDFVGKPIDPDRLVQSVSAQFPSRRTTTPPPAPGRQVILVEAESTQLRLSNIRLTSAGYGVTLASSGAEALERARVHVPDAIVANTFMPAMDGFELCVAVRRDPLLSHIPVILMSSAGVDEPEKDLARRAGATALVERSPDLEQVADALAMGVRTRSAPPPSSTSDWRAAQLSRVVRQLDRQASLNAVLLQRCALQAAELSVLGGIADSLARQPSGEVALDDVLARCIDAGGISVGVLYLEDSDGNQRVAASSGYAGSPDGRLAGLFGYPDVLSSAVHNRVAFAIPSSSLDEETGAALLSAAGVWSALLAPVVVHGRPIGALFLGSKLQDLTEEDWPAFARTVAGQLGLAVALAKAFQTHSAPLRLVGRPPE
jgi:two-component system cell cycle response regulator